MPVGNDCTTSLRFCEACRIALQNVPTVAALGVCVCVSVFEMGMMFDGKPRNEKWKRSAIKLFLWGIANWHFLGPSWPCAHLAWNVKGWTG